MNEPFGFSASVPCAGAASTVTVTAVNDPPVALDDSYATPEDTVLTVEAPGVLENDSDVDGDGLTAQLVGDTTFGSLVLNSDGSFDYTPNAGYFGLDKFTYQAYDGEEPSNLVDVTILVIVYAPYQNFMPMIQQ